MPKLDAAACITPPRKISCTVAAAKPVIAKSWLTPTIGLLKPRVLKGPDSANAARHTNSVSLKFNQDTRSLSTEPLAPLLLSLKHAMAGLDESSESESSKGNVCERWLRCPADDALRELTGVDALPDCPCTYSTASSRAGQSRWKDVSLLDGKLDIYNPGAARCIRSEPALSSSVDRHKWTGLSVQNCCYDEANTLLTRGSGAGSPHYVSPEISPSLHRFVDILPWLACKGDFTRFHASREPNNGNHCPVNPDEATFAEQVQAATTF
ncbi:unnamed protein product [Notodromas monacha]|uniref:AMOP domain-containing protein n=1 Tax=Notodromas monacha TaxID=399045 RepID=A0A7R9GBR2_9CRUS|nr:unnamed protein product [Notodromas monacha]CAG0915071.1 unnamed protein product [Notodromas monacha]